MKVHQRVWRAYQGRSQIAIKRLPVHSALLAGIADRIHLLHACSAVQGFIRLLSECQCA